MALPNFVPAVLGAVVVFLANVGEVAGFLISSNRPRKKSLQARCPSHDDPQMDAVRKHLDHLVKPQMPEGGRGQVTLLTHGTYDRIAGLELTLKNWGGPVSVAFFAHKGQEAIKIKRWVKQTNWTQGSSVTLAFATVSQYPINFLRNVALAAAQTEWVFPLDIDFTPSIGAYQNITTHLPRSKSGVLVLPAFELDPTSMGRMKRLMSTLSSDIDIDHPPLTKQDLLKSGAVDFHKYWAPAHEATNSAMWTSQSGGTYDIDVGRYVHESYEPYLVVRRAGLPRYDERFDGYGFNKVSWVLCLRCSMYSFSVLEDAFVMHIEHTKQHEVTRDAGNKRNNIAMDEFVKELRCPYSVSPTRNAHTLF